MNYLIHLCLLFSFASSASTITGTVSDPKEPLYGATVVVLEKSDSTMVAFGLTNEDGKFEIHEVPSGDYVLQVSYTGFNEYYQDFKVEEGVSAKELPLIILSESNAILQEVSIEAERIPMGILGDTIDYNAAAFKTRKGASVEDLLKKMPGIEVARDGSIKAQGKDVENVLVDGKEFFSGDPKMATQNLEAEAVDKVQVYDKKSEEAEFTGVDDGQEEKTINLKLKEDYKNGGFGKMALEGGTEETQLAKINYNRFSPSMQASIIGNVNNINQQAFSFNDYIQFMGGLSNVMSGGGFQDNDLFSGSNGQPKGINDRTALGTNLNYDFTSKLKTNFNYLYAAKETHLREVGLARNFTDDLSFVTSDTLSSNSQNDNHRGSFKIDYKHNPRNALKLKSSFGFDDKMRVEDAITQYQGVSLPTSLTLNDQQSFLQNFNWNVDANYKRKFATKGRSWISSVRFDRATQKEDLNLDNGILLEGILDRLIQKQNLDGISSDLKLSSKYAEPIGKGLYLGANYSLGANMQNPSRRFYNLIGQEYALDQNLSDDFERNWNTHSFGLSLRRNRKKIKLNSKLTLLQTSLETVQLKDLAESKSNNSYLLPSINIDLNLKGSKRLEFYYSTNVNAPSISQLISIPNNANPNFLVLGNTALNPEYVHSVGSSFSSFDQFNFSSLFSNFNLSYSPNKIVNSRTFKEDFTTEILPINSSNYWSARIYGNHGRPIRPLKIKYSINTNIIGEKYTTLLNSIANDITSLNVSADLRFENRKKDFADVAVGFRFDANDYNSSFNTSGRSMSYSWYADLSYNITESLFLSATYDYLTFDASFVGDTDVQHLINISLRQSILNDQLAIELRANDLLNETVGISRFGTQSAVSDRRYNTLSRYFTLGVSYRIGKVKNQGITITE